jgi:hypothetical protein
MLCCAVYVQVVVDDDRVGIELVKLLNKAGRGRMTFMPLNRLQVSDLTYPTQFKQDAVPLHKLLKCPDKYKKAVQQVIHKCSYTSHVAKGFVRGCTLCLQCLFSWMMMQFLLVVFNTPTHTHTDARTHGPLPVDKL